jgi:hypothetical protein
MPRSLARPAPEWQAAAVAGGVLGVLTAAWIAAALARLAVRRAVRTVRFGYRVATFTLYRPCADCHKWIHADARVCHRCGYRKPPRGGGGR